MMKANDSKKVYVIKSEERIVRPWVCFHEPQLWSMFKAF